MLEMKDENPPNGFFTSAPNIFSETVDNYNGLAGEKLLAKCFIIPKVFL